MIAFITRRMCDTEAYYQTNVPEASRSRAWGSHPAPPFSLEWYAKTGICVLRLGQRLWGRFFLADLGSKAEEASNLDGTQFVRCRIIP